MKEKLTDDIWLFRDKWMISYVVDDDRKLQIDAGAPTDSRTEILILTHCHFDHIQHIPDCEIAASQKTADHLAELDIATIFFKSPKKLEPIKVTRILKGGDIINTGKYEFKVIETPGHTDGGICLYDENHGILFSGDTLFHDDIPGRVDLPSADPLAMEESLRKLKKLKINHLFPGHAPDNI